MLEQNMLISTSPFCKYFCTLYDLQSEAVGTVRAHTLCVWLVNAGHLSVLSHWVCLNTVCVTFALNLVK